MSETHAELSGDFQQGAERTQTRKLRKLWFAWLMNLSFFQRHKPDLLCPGVYPKPIVLFAALGHLLAILSP